MEKSYKLSDDGTTAVDPEYFYKTLDTCPRGASVWLLTRYGVAVTGNYTGQTDMIGWCPKAKIPEHIKKLML